MVGGRAVAPLAVNIHSGMAELLHKPLYEKQGGLLAVDFPIYFGDVEHGRVTMTFPDPVTSISCKSFFFPTLTALLQLSQGAGPGRRDKAPLFVRAVPEPPSHAADLPRCPGMGYDLQSRTT